jgi:DNA ligase-1
MIINFKPQLCPNEKVDLDTIKYPIYASTKLDGIRCVFHPTLGMVSRSLKPIPNKQLQEKFKKLTEWAKDNNCVLDGEIYAHGVSFQDITRACMTEDFDDEKTVKKLQKEIMSDAKHYSKLLIDSMQFNCFDCLPFNDLCNSFIIRYAYIQTLAVSNPDIVVVKQTLVNSKEEVMNYFETVLDVGYEGLILKDPYSIYKFGRGTIKEGICYKVKPYVEKSAIIKGIVQATQVIEGAQKLINELGYSVTSKKKDDRVLIEKASAFLVDWEGKDLKVTIAADDKEKERIWKNAKDYIGKEVGFKAMDVGAKDLPRHPVALRWWLKDE